jgi:ribosomal protein S18 acetylase RimI-like enzyme
MLMVLRDQEWRLLRELRLAAQRESPLALLSSHEDESQLDEQHWRREARCHTWLALFDFDRPVGLIGAIRDDEIPTTDRYLVSLWIEPSYRRKGIARLLIEATVSRLRDEGVTAVWLWVFGDNLPAKRLYRRLGFVSTGDRQPLPTDPSRIEERMRRELD